MACFLLQGLLAAQLHGDAMVRKKSHLYIKTNILPRQARDKHRENSKRTTVFLIGGDLSRWGALNLPNYASVIEHKASGCLVVRCPLPPDALAAAHANLRDPSASTSAFVGGFLTSLVASPPLAVSDDNGTDTHTHTQRERERERASDRLLERLGRLLACLLACLLVHLLREVARDSSR